MDSFSAKQTNTAAITDQPMSPKIGHISQCLQLFPNSLCLKKYWSWRDVRILRKEKDISYVWWAHQKTQKARWQTKFVSSLLYEELGEEEHIILDSQAKIITEGFLLPRFTICTNRGFCFIAVDKMFQPHYQQHLGGPSDYRYPGLSLSIGNLTSRMAPGWWRLLEVTSALAQDDDVDDD